MPYRFLYLTLASADLMALRCNTYDTDNFICSDHVTYHKASNKRAWTTGRLVRKANFAEFSAVLDLNLRELESDDGETLHRHFSGCLSYSPKDPAFPWSNVTIATRSCGGRYCSRVVRRKNAMILKRRRSLHVDDVIAFKKARAKCSRVYSDQSRNAGKIFASR